MKFKSRLLKKEIPIITDMVNTITDYYGEFFVTKNNLRLFLKDNQSLLFDSLKQGDKIIYNKDIIIFITGIAENSNRKYIKFLYKNILAIDNLLQDINYKNIDYDLFTKIKKNNPLLQILLHYGYVQIGDRGKELLLVKYKKDK